MADISHITIPVLVDGVETPVTFNIKDAAARQAISDLGDVLSWLGVTTTELTDGATTSPITISGQSVVPAKGNVAQYSGEEFAWNGTSWQSLGKNNFGALAFANEVVASYTPVGTVSQPTASTSGGSSETVNSITDVGTLPTMTVTSETLVFDPGTLPTKGANQTVVGSVGTITVTQPTFTGTAANITSAPAP